MSHFDQPVPCATRRLVWQLPGAALLATCGMPAWTQAAPTEIRLVSDEWHKTARKDGTGLYFDLIRMVYEKHGVKV
ncbi:MAG: hypothetical protein JWP29_3101 [Rhodoferax sp.]|nr:hypothetical protein [Rhodoferax sp.]